MHPVSQKVEDVPYLHHRFTTPLFQLGSLNFNFNLTSNAQQFIVMMK